MLGDDAVRKLVEQDRAEKEEAGEQADAPLLRFGPMGVALGEKLPEGKRTQRENHDPSGMQVNGDPENPRNFES
jgi:hypothetical protein